jgi:hypothetical protein
MLPCYPGECNLENVYLLGEFYHKWLQYKYGSNATALPLPTLSLPKPRSKLHKRRGILRYLMAVKGNDQVSFEGAFSVLQPSIKVIGPWHMPEFYKRIQGRNDLFDYAAKAGISVSSTKSKQWSIREPRRIVTRLV